MTIFLIIIAILFLWCISLPTLYKTVTHDTWLFTRKKTYTGLNVWQRVNSKFFGFVLVPVGQPFRDNKEMFYELK